MKMMGMISLLSIFWWGGCTFPPEFQAHQAGDFEHHFKTRKVYSVLVDGRSAADFAAGHLHNATNIPFADDFLERVDQHLTDRNAPKSLLLFLYLADGEQTREAIGQLKAQAANSPRLKHKIRVVHYPESGYPGQ